MKAKSPHDKYAIIVRSHINHCKISLSRRADFSEKRLKNPPFHRIMASFWFVNIQKTRHPQPSSRAKGHQTHRRFFYFESCVCQKKRTSF